MFITKVDSLKFYTNSQICKLLKLLICSNRRLLS